MEFSELIRRARAGEAKARDDIHRKYERIVMLRVRDGMSPLLRRRFETLDLSNSVFAEVLGDLPGFEDRGESAFRHWLYLKAESKVRSKLRKQLTPSGGRREATLSALVGDRVRSGGPGPATQADRADAMVCLARILEAMESGQREILLLRTEGSLSFADIADLLDLASPDAARKRYARALIALRDRWPET